MNRIKIHFARLRPGQEPIDLACALRVGGFDQPRGPAGAQQHKYDQLNRQAGELFEPATVDDADLIFYSYRAQDNAAEAIEVAREAKARGLPSLFLSWGDADVAVSVPYGVVYRHSLFSDRQLPWEKAMPALCSDPLLETGHPLATREKQDLPSVGFCGFVSNPLMRLAYRALGRARKAEGLDLRSRILRSLRRCPKVKTDFICRNAYWAGTTGRFHHDPAAQARPRQEFLDNLLGTDYTVCVRGAGNFSYRLYESLAAGRIPLFINTRCVLPFEDQIDWKRHCVWVEEDQVPRAGEILADFHSQITAEAFAQMQQDNRQLWEERLSPLGFYRHACSAAVHPGLQEPSARHARSDVGGHNA